MAINNYKLSKELEYLLSSYLFENKLQMQRLLKYLVHHANSSSESAFDQRAIARECLGRSPDFDPAENPVVRIEIGRLRKLLNNFYDEDSPRPYKITIPLGQYRPEIVAESIATKPKYLPDLSPSPANPERLSVLLQFTTEGKDNADLYLLRHRIRIGITVALGRQEAIRLLVAIPGEDGNGTDSIDFIMRVSLSSVDSEFGLASVVRAAESKEVIFSKQKSLAFDYQSSEVDDLLSILVSELFDHEIGCLWRVWVNKRQEYKSSSGSKVATLVSYQRCLFDENEKNIRTAFYAIKTALEHHPGDKILNLALADIYFRIIINDYNIVAEPIEEGLTHVREALRFSPASQKLHTLHALMALFEQEYCFAATSIFKTENFSGAKYFSCLFNHQVLECFISGWEEGFDELNDLCQRFSCYPKLFPTLAYVNYFLLDERAQSEKWKAIVLDQETQSSVKQCINYMVLPRAWSGQSGRQRLLRSVEQDLTNER